MPTPYPISGVPPAFPVRTISFGLAATIALLLASTFLTWRVGDEIRHDMDAQVQVLTAAEKVSHYGTILELSIKDVVNYGDPTSAARYRHVQPQLRKILTKLRAQVQDKEQQSDAVEVDQSDLELIAMEYRAMRLVEQGKLAQARSIIYSPRYDYLVDVYYEGVLAIEARAARFAEATRWQLKRDVWLIVAMSAVSLILVILGWIALIIPTRHWGNELDRARAAAESAARFHLHKRSELELLNGQLFDQARLDPLTGAFTRLKFSEDIAQLWPRLERNGTSACAMMCDVDFFKQYNDTFGHIAGDRVLRDVAAALDGVRRGGDQLYRMGGEEFLVLLHDCTLDQAARRAEDYRAAVENMAIPHPASPLGRVTVSVGVAPLGGGKHASIEQCLTSADEAMYEAKARGRNAVVSNARVAA